MNNQTTYAPPNTEYEISKNDLIEDFQEIVYLLGKPQAQLNFLKHHPLAIKIKNEIAHVESQANAYIDKVRTMSGSAINALEGYLHDRDNLQAKVREYLKMVALLSWEGEWQSPTFTDQIPKMKGLYTGVISHTINDYKRDQHALAREYELAFMKEYYPTTIFNSFSALTTTSGMASFTLILQFLIAERVEHFAVGKHSYFEIKTLTKSLLKNPVSFDEANPSTLEKFCAQTGKKTIFFDTVANDKTVFHTDIDALLSYLQKNAPSAYVVIDNTVSSFTVPVQKYQQKYPRLSIIGFESLNKFHQFGLDMVTGGIIYTKSLLIGKIHPYRKHLGLIIPDFSALLLPKPNKLFLRARINRLHRNTNVLTRSLYPDRKIEPANAPFFAFSFPLKKDTIKQYLSFCKKVYQEAEKKKVCIAGGSSFGLNKSRLYLTALRSTTSKPFVRFSPGTETMHEMNAIIKILRKYLPR